MRAHRFLLPCVAALFLVSTAAVAVWNEDRDPPSSRLSVAALIARLDADAFLDREQATEELKQRGRALVPELEAALEKAKSQEMRWRLQKVLAWYAPRVEWYTDAAAFRKRLGGKVRLVDFDDLKTPDKGWVPFAADHYAKKHGIVIQGKGGQFASRSFGFPDHYFPSSRPNMYAPGPTAPVNRGKGAGGYETDVTFVANKKSAAVAGFGVVFIDADYPQIGPCQLAVLGRKNKRLDLTAGFGGANGSRLFRGAVTVDRTGKLLPTIHRVHLVNGCNWAGVAEGEGATLDDFLFAVPVPREEGASKPEK
jgi:hypothetical protein